MKKIGIIYGIIHLLVEIICFQILYKEFAEPIITLSIAMIFDFFAFMPQSLIGVIADKYKTLKISYIGTILMLIAIILATININNILTLFFLGIGNACLHESGAIATTTIDKPKLTPSAIFVGGGSFGVIIGQTMGMFNISLFCSYIAIILIFILVFISNKQWITNNRKTVEFNLIKEHCNYWTVILIAFLIVTARSFIAYAIPISWKKELWQSFLLFFTMGFGKMLGGILSDIFGTKKIGILSTILCIPFLLFGKNIMILSIIGVFLFSMTMPITYGMLLSVLKKSPGLAFGITTIGLFIGLIPLFLFGSFSIEINNILIIILSIFSSFFLLKTLK